MSELADAIGMEQSAVSHQLRLLRNLGLVTGTRAGRSIVYSLYDNHVAQLLDEAVYHSEHLRLGLPEQPKPQCESEAARQRPSAPTHEMPALPE